jgi:hypothetical protein
MQFACRATVIGLLLLAASAQANPVTSLSHYYVVKDGTQNAILGVSDNGNASAEDIEGMTFTLQIGAGIGSAPSIGAVDFLTNSIWTDHVSAGNVSNAAGGNEPQFKSFSLITNNFGEFVNANGNLASFGFNGAGAALGDYPLKIVFTKDAGSDSQFFSGLGTNVTATFGNGILTVVAPGDFTRDNHVNAGDIAAMMAALTDLNAYKTAKDLDNAGLVAIGDFNGDHEVTNADLQGLLNLLKSGGGSLSAVPEPAGWIMAASALLLLAGIWRRKNCRTGCIKRELIAHF